MRALLYFILMTFTLMSCTEKRTVEDHGHDHSEQKGSGQKYTCPMHPQVVQDGPGRCPVCGMDLVPVNKGEPDSDDLMLSDSQVKLANITTQKVSVKPVGQTLVVNARLAVDEALTEMISSRVAGRIERLFIKETGRRVERGEPLYEIYSETLLTLQQEYLLAKEQFEALDAGEGRYAAFLKAAERKLLLYGLTKEQVSQLGKSGQVRQKVTFLAPSNGVVTEILAAEGQYLPEGGPLYRIEDIGSLWLEAELYPGEASLVKIGDKIRVRVDGHASAPMEAKVTFLSPEYRTNTQVIVMRAEIENHNGRFKPGMQAHVLFSHSSRKAIAVPTDAVIRDGRGTHVYVQKGNNTFRPRMVRTGLEDFEQVEITEGLAEGDTVAISGAYLLYSEIILKKGSDPMAGP